MTNLIRYSPIDDAFDDLFRGFLMRPVRMEGMPEMQIKMDISEDDQAYTVHAELPGVKKDDINVTIDNGRVAISAEVRNGQEVKEGNKVLRSERYYGKVSRTFSMEQDVDESAARAKYSDGVLELVLPKKAAAASRKLSIN